MKHLSTAILNAAANAHSSYANHAGNWLFHAPEFYITVHVARGIARNGWEVWCDASPRKIIEANTGSRQGRAPKNKNWRFDIVVWHRADATVKAIIEVKRAWEITSLEKDADKLLKQKVKVRASAKSGYLLVYSEARHRAGERTARSTLENRFKKWAKALEATVAGIRARAPRDADWAWGFALLRVF